MNKIGLMFFKTIIFINMVIIYYFICNYFLNYTLLIEPHYIGIIISISFCFGIMSILDFLYRIISFIHYRIDLYHIGM
jgi:hypothetical protein